TLLQPGQGAALAEQLRLQRGQFLQRPGRVDTGQRGGAGGVDVGDHEWMTLPVFVAGLRSTLAGSYSLRSAIGASAAGRRTAKPDAAPLTLLVFLGGLRSTLAPATGDLEAQDRRCHGDVEALDPAGVRDRHEAVERQAGGQPMGLAAEHERARTVER